MRGRDVPGAWSGGRPEDAKEEEEVDDEEDEEEEAEPLRRRESTWTPAIDTPNPVSSTSALETLLAALAMSASAAAERGVVVKAPRGGVGGGVGTGGGKGVGMGAEWLRCSPAPPITTTTGLSCDDAEKI